MHGFSSCPTYYSCVAAFLCGSSSWPTCLLWHVTCGLAVLVSILPAIMKDLYYLLVNISLKADSLVATATHRQCTCCQSPFLDECVVACAYMDPSTLCVYAITISCLQVPVCKLAYPAERLVCQWCCLQVFLHCCWLHCADHVA